MTKLNKFMLEYENGIKVIHRDKATRVEDVRIPGNWNEGLRSIALMSKLRST